MAVCQNLVPLVNIKIVGKWMFIPLKMVLIGIDPYPHSSTDPKTAAVPLLSILPPGRPSCLSEIVAWVLMPNWAPGKCEKPYEMVRWARWAALLGTQALLVVHLLHEMDLFLDWSHWTSIHDSSVRLFFWLVVKSTRNPPKFLSNHDHIPLIFHLHPIDWFTSPVKCQVPRRLRTELPTFVQRESGYLVPQARKVVSGGTTS